MITADHPRAVEAISAWLTAHLGTVIAIERQERWRPAWMAQVETAEGPTKVYVRSGRGKGLETRPLSHEYAVLQLLAQQGVPVPTLYGWCPEPEAIVMEALDDHPFHGGADNDPQLQSMVQDYMAVMADIHRIPLANVRQAGIDVPVDSEDIALAYFRLADAAYQAGRGGAEPLIEFLRGWVLRNVPRHRTQAALLVADAPQFFHDGEAITAIYDLEMAHVGDPMMDLASIRVRDINEPIGHLPRLLGRYIAEGGEPIDWPALDFHTLVSFLAVPMMTKPTLRQSHPHPAFVEYLSWDLASSRAGLEVLAEILGIQLEPVAPVPQCTTSYSDAFVDIAALAEGLPPPDGLLREAPLLSLARYLKRVDEIGAEIEQLERSETETLLETNFASSAEAEVALEVFVRTCGSEHEPILLRLFHRRVLRRLQLLRDYPAPIVARGLGSTR